MSNATIESRSPQNPSDVVVSVPVWDRSAVVDAVDIVRRAAREWAAEPAHTRSAALTKAAGALEAASSEVTDLMVREVGKPIGEAQGEAARGIAILRYYSQQALDPDGETYPPGDGRSLLISRRYPRGVAGLITPWNFPVAIPLWKLAPALAFGNGVVLKPSPLAVGCAERLAELFAGILPDGLLRVVHGGGETGEALVASVDVVSFTGSVPVGHEVAVSATRRGIPVQAEMGGQNASVVLPDTDTEFAAATIAKAAMGYAGQKCTATSRVIVVGDSDPFTEALAAAVRELAVGDPADTATVVGPLIRAEARDNLVEAAAQAESEGGKVVAGGTTLQGDGYFVEPTLVSGLRPDAQLAQREVFGPIAAVLGARDADEAVAITNGVDYGLVTAVFTRDLDQALALMGRIDTGLVKVNAPTSGVDFHAPFGGEKASSIGPREQGKAARDLYTTTHTIIISPAGS